MANKTIEDLTAAGTLTGAELFYTVQAGNSRKVALSQIKTHVLSTLQWHSKAVGEPFALWDNLTGVGVPPTNDTNFRFIKLTAADAYNNGVLTTETVTGSAPLVQATAVIADSNSPMDGQTIRLINTERRFLRAGAAGTVQDDALQGHVHSIAARQSGSGFQAGAGVAPFESAGSTSTAIPSSDGTNGTPRTANETRGKNIGATFYMRIR